MSVARYYSPRMRKLILAGKIPDWLAKHPRLSYIVACNLSYPDWVDRREIDKLRREAIRLTKETGTRYVIDHIVPVTHPHVCGLSVPWNMRVVPYAVNASKGNKWNPHQLELFT